MSPAVPLLEASGLVKHFPVRRGLMGWSTAVVRAVDSVSFTIPAGTTKVELWFQNSSGGSSTCVDWDSLGGFNYTFSVAP